MPIPQKTPLITLMRVEAKHVATLKRILTRSATAINKEILKLPEGSLTRMQLEAQKASINAYLTKDFTDIERLVQQGQLDAARAASAVVSRYENQLLEKVLDKKVMERLAASEAQRAANGVQVALRRMEGTSYKPLSKQVYDTKKLTSKWIDDKINQALASGWDRTRLAREISSSINPNTPGGVSYAANRLARTEINNAFHASSAKRYEESVIVEGVDWHLSSSHPEGDICDTLADESPYPKKEVPQKPHPNCYCYITPALPTEEEFLDNLFAGKYDPDDAPWASEVSGGRSPATDRVDLMRFQTPNEAMLAHVKPNTSAPKYDRETGRWSGSEEAFAIRNYTLNSRAINDSMRKTGRVTRANKELHDQLQSVMGELQQDIKLVRGVPKAAINEALAKVGGDPKNLVGATLHDKAFQSTTIKDGVAGDFGVWTLNIHAPKGTRGAYLGDLSAFPDQDEFLLPPGSNFYVAGVREGSKKGKMILDVILTQDGA